MDRTKERESVIFQYNQYSKKAANLLTVLIIYSVFFGYALVERHLEVESARTKWDCQNREIELNHGIKNPTNFSWSDDKPSKGEFVYESAFKTNKKIPFLNFEISGVAFFFLGPVIFSIMSIFYLAYLSNANIRFKKLNSFLNYNENLSNYLHPTAYNLKFKSLSFMVFWQILLEIFPIILLIIFFMEYFPTIKFLSIYYWLFSVFIILPFILHIQLFEIDIFTYRYSREYLENKLKSIYSFLYLFVFLILIFLFFYVDISRNANSYLYHIFIGYNFLMLSLILEIILFGISPPHISFQIFILAISPILILFILILKFFDSIIGKELTLKDFLGLIYLINPFNELAQDKKYGYYGYIKERYRFLKSLK